LELKNKSYLILETKNIFKFLQKNEFLGQHKRKKWHGRQEGGGLKKKKNNNRYNLEVAWLKLAGCGSLFSFCSNMQTVYCRSRGGKVKSKTHSHIRQAQTSFMLRNWGRQLS